MKSFVALSLLAANYAIRLNECNCSTLAGVGTITIPGNNPCTTATETEYYLNDACSAGAGSTTIELNNNCGFGGGTIEAENTVENICEPL